VSQTWARGHAALYLGEWPCHVLSVAAPRLRATVRFLGGDAPEKMPAEASVALSSLVRPKGWRWLDKSLRFIGSRQAPWTGAALRALRDEWGTRPATEIAASVGRTEKACSIAMYRWWGRKRQQPARSFTSRQVARLLGWDDHRVTRLIAEGVLRGTKSGIKAGANVRWLVTADDLDDFLYRHPERYDWRQIKAGPWRDRAEAIHSADPLLSVDDVARRLCLTTRAVGQRIRLGDLPAVWSDGGSAGSARRWLVRQSVVDAIDVDAFLRPRRRAA